MVNATVRAGTLVVNGELVGNVHASERVELTGKARVFGDLESPVVVLDEGVMFEGHCRMPRPGRPSPMREAAAVVLAQALMSDRRGGGFTLVLVHSGGTRMLHVGCPRWLLWVGLTLLLMSGALLAGTWMDYFALKRAHLQAAALERRVEEQRAQLEAFEQRVAEVNREVAGWQDMHVRLWSAFGPAPGQAGKGTGMGGAVAVLPLVFASEGPALPQQLAFLASTVSESGQSLRALGRFVERTRSVLLAMPFRWPVRGPLNSRFGQRQSPWTGELRVPSRPRHQRRPRHSGVRAGHRQRALRGRGRRVRQHRHPRSRARAALAVRPPAGDPREARRPRRARPAHRAHRQYRPHLRPAPALRDPAARPGRRSPPVPLGVVAT